MGVELCGNGIDDDRDGRVDCADDSCDDAPECALIQSDDKDAFVPLNPNSALGRVLRGDCSDDPAEHRTGAQRPDCQLFPDDCGYGRRCVPLSVQGRYLRSRCVRQGCATPYQVCAPARGKDRCPRHTLCVEAPKLCAQGSCCVPLCELSQRLGGCSSCAPLRSLFELGEGDPSLRGVGLCLSPR